MQYFHRGFCKWNWQAHLHRTGRIVSKCFTKVDGIKMAKIIINLCGKKKLHWIQIKKSQNHWDESSNVKKNASFSLSSLKESLYVGPKVPVVLMFLIKVYIFFMYDFLLFFFFLCMIFFFSIWFACHSLFLLLRVLFIPKKTWQVSTYEKMGHFNYD